MKVIIIPQDIEASISVIDAGTDWRGLVAAVNGPGGSECRSVEAIPIMGPLTAAFPNIRLVGDEEPSYHRSTKLNVRATVFYPYGRGLRGNVLMVEEGMTDDGPDFVDMRDPEGMLARAIELVEAALDIMSGN
jgi:hypothetical protein